MILDQDDLKFYQKIVEDQYSVLILNDYQNIGKEKMILVMDTLYKLYPLFDYSSFENIVIYSTMDLNLSLQNIPNSNYKLHKSINNLAQLSGTQLTIEIRDNNDLLISLDFIPSLNDLRANSVVYQRINEVESFLGKTQQKPLPTISNTDSYFSVQTYKGLESALDAYDIIVARHSTKCPYLRNVWFDKNKIFFKPKPEDDLRDSLIYFLEIRLRDVAEVRHEQVIYGSLRVDIKVTWNFTKKIGLIEIKWLGKSLASFGVKFSANYSNGRANEGADQLAKYLDLNKISVPTRNTKGYLVIFEGRRWQTNNNTQYITKKNGLHYDNKAITYNTDYANTRPDFAKPIRFFMEPICTL